jgi:uncharacterized protein YbjQ (UPF0145 family)
MFFNQSQFDIITTTNSLEGWTIKKYHEPVFSHVVAGTNIFSDFFAALSDVVGFRSGAYQYQLETINNIAIKELKKAAAVKGANCIIGLRVDHDDISGKHKSMFMVTASGTPVTAEKNPGSEDIQELFVENEILSHSEMETAIAKTGLIQQATEGNFNFSEEDWNFIIQTKMEELVPIFVNHLVNLHRKAKDMTEEDEMNEALVKIKKVLVSFIPEKVTPHIYPLLEESDNQKVFNYVYEVIKEINGVDYKRLKLLLQHDSIDVKKRALKILVLEKSRYTNVDLENMRTISRLLKEQFSTEEKIIKQKSLLGGKEKSFWVCSCGNKNELEYARCKKCRKGRQGFSRKDITPKAAATILEKKISVLEQYI